MMAALAALQQAAWLVAPAPGCLLLQQNFSDPGGPASVFFAAAGYAEIWVRSFLTEALRSRLRTFFARRGGPTLRPHQRVMAIPAASRCVQV